MNSTPLASFTITIPAGTGSSPGFLKQNTGGATLLISAASAPFVMQFDATNLFPADAGYVFSGESFSTIGFYNSTANAIKVTYVVGTAGVTFIGNQNTKVGSSYAKGNMGINSAASLAAFTGSYVVTAVPNPCSISLWFNGVIPSGGDNLYPAMLSNNPGGFSVGAFSIRWGNSRNPDVTVHWYGQTFTADPAIDSGALMPGVWTHVVVTRTGATLSLYINAVLVGTYTGDTISAINLGDGGNLLFGGNTWDGTQSFYNGLLDQVRVYSGVLSQAQITALYNNP